MLPQIYPHTTELPGFQQSVWPPSVKTWPFRYPKLVLKQGKFYTPDKLVSTSTDELYHAVGRNMILSQHHPNMCTMIYI